MTYLVVWARPVTVFRSPRRAACFPSLNKVRPNCEKGNAKNHRREETGCGPPCNGQRSVAHVSPFRRVHRGPGRMGCAPGGRAKPLRGHPPPGRARAEGEEMSGSNNQRWPAARIQRQLRADEALIEMVRAERVFL